VSSESEVETMASERSNEARANLQAWYLRSLLPKLSRAARTKVVNPEAVEALDADVRSLLDISREREEAA
jgi:hypothetical protein